MIGVYDSGVGGLGILYELQRRLPHKSFLYLADTANCPYGKKTDKQIREFARRAVSFLINQGAELVVVACNTATVTSLDYLRSWFSIPIVGVVPVIKTAAELTRNNRIGVLGTDVTISSGYQRDLMQKFAGDKEIFSISNPRLVDMIEKGTASEDELLACAAESMDIFKKQGIDTLVLGCTHYTLIRDIFEHLAGGKIIVLDSNDPVARHTERLVHEHGLHGTSYNRSNRFVVTKDPQRFQKAVERYLTPHAFVEEMAAPVDISVPEKIEL